MASHTSVQHSPVVYRRKAQEWSRWLGRRGQVVASTVIRVAPPELASSAPYSYAVVAVDGQQLELMGVDHQEFMTGDSVELVLRRLGEPDEAGLIPYGLKIQKVTS